MENCRPEEQVLEGYKVRPTNMLALLRFYWDNQCCVVARIGKYPHAGEAFVPEDGGVTQGAIIYLILFNILVNAVLQKWYADVMEDITSAITGLEGDAIKK